MGTRVTCPSESRVYPWLKLVSQSSPLRRLHSTWNGGGGLQAVAAGKDAGLDFAEAVQKQFVVGHGLFHQLLEQKHFGTADDGVDAVPEGFHGREGLERIAEQNDRGMAALVDGHGLQRLEGEIFVNGVCAEQFLDHDHLIMRLAEAHEKIAVRGGGVDLIAQFLQRGLRGLQPFGRGKGDQGRFVLGADEIE